MHTTREEDRTCGRFICSTDDVAPRERIDYYSEVVSQVYPGLAIHWPAERPVQARMESVPFAGARVTEFANTSNSIVHRPGLHAPGRYQLVLHLAGSARYRQGNRETVRQPGDLILLDTDLCFEAEYPSDLHLMIWELPRESLAPLLAEPEDAAGRPIPGQAGPGAVLAGFARTVGREAVRTSAPERRALLGHLCGLAALGVGAAAPARESRHLSYRAAQRQRVLAYVEAHFSESSLSAARAASELRLSRRGLYDLLRDDELGFAALVSRRRVEECARLLAEPALDDVSITAIAWRCGFGDLSTFNRRFRAQHGMSPREFRRDRDAAAAGSTRPASGAAKVNASSNSA